MPKTMREVAAELVHMLDEAGDGDRAALARLLYVRVAMRQAYVTVAGETSSGKSSIINGMFGRRLLPVGGGPTTGTVTHMICLEDGNDRHFAVYRDATQEEIGRDEFVELNMRPPKNLLRLQVRASPELSGLAGLHVFDTPGYNSMVAEHGEVLEEFLPQSDVVVFVVGYRTGFGQDDQDLLESVAAFAAPEQDIPVILVINRVPPGITSDNRRLAEIVSNASDTLGRVPELVIVDSFSADGAGSTPDTGTLWRRVAEMVAEPQRQAAIDAKLRGLLHEMIVDADDRAERQELALLADEDQVREQAEVIQVLRRQRDASLAVVEKTTERLRLLVPANIQAATDDLHASLAAEVAASNKWLGSTDCAEWISGHFLPFEVRGIARSVEEQIAGELRRLDEELQEIANTAVNELSRRVTIGTNRGKFAVNLAGTLARRIGGAAWRSLLRGVGGVGGTAAGAGNLVKMVVSRAGKLVGKTFSREVYSQIGRTFNKQLMRRLNVVVTIVLEVGSYIYKSTTWQAELVSQVAKGLDEWKMEVMDDLLAQQLPSIHEANVNSVKDIYDDLIASDAKCLDGQDTDRRLEEIRSLRASFSMLRDALEAIPS